MFLVISGRLRRLASPGTGTGTGLGDVGRGQCIGEVSVLREAGEPHSCRPSAARFFHQREHSVMCVRDCEVVAVSAASYERIARSNPDLVQMFAAVMAERFSQLMRRVNGDGGLTNASLPYQPPLIRGPSTGAWGEADASVRPSSGVSGSSGPLDGVFPAPSHRHRQLPGNHSRAPMGQRGFSVGSSLHSVSSHPADGSGSGGGGGGTGGGGKRRRGKALRRGRGVSGSYGDFASLEGMWGGGIGGAVTSLSTGVGGGAATGGPNNIVTVAILPAGGTPPVPTVLLSFAAQLVTVLSSYGATTLITARTVDAALGTGTASRLGHLFERARAGAWFSGLEEKHRFVVFVGDSQPTAWSQVVMAHADLALLVGVGTSSGELSAVEREVVFAGGVATAAAAGVAASAPSATEATSTSTGGGASVPVHAKSVALSIRSGIGATGRLLKTIAHAVVGGGGGRGRVGSKSGTRVGGAGDGARVRGFVRLELVLLHPEAGVAPRGTREWLRRRSVSWHHHVRLTYPGDVERLGRFMTGTAVGLVLSGGGCRGLAHIGVLRSLEQRGIPVDFIGGTSMGSYVAGAWAQTLSVSATTPAGNRMANSIGSWWFLLSNLTLPILSYYSGVEFNEIMTDQFGDVQIEDLWIMYFCCTTNVSRDTMDVHQVRMCLGKVGEEGENGEVTLDVNVLSM
jgi:hypothetical protein